jgi:catechol 2,3-dioxygenase-like lactoylglutathione lyase family enzyme
MFKRIVKIFAVIPFLLLLSCGDNRASDMSEDTRDIIANNAFLYYKDYQVAKRFYSEILGFENVFEIERFSTIFQTSPTTFITIVSDDGTGRAMHSADEPKTVAIALITDHVSEWYDYAMQQNLNIRAPLKPLGDRTYQSFFVTDPGGYILEFEYLARHPQNKKPQRNSSQTRIQLASKRCVF